MTCVRIQVLSTSVAKLANLEGLEELVAEDSPIKDSLPDQSF
jgi:hypothetical protein